MKESEQMEIAVLKMLEKDFERIIRDLSTDPSMNEFRKNYERMFKALKTSHDREKELLQGCESLTSHINENAGKIKEVLTIAQEDSQTITKLKTELNDAKSVLKLLKERDKESQSKIESLSKVLGSLKIVTDQHHKANAGRISQFEQILEEQTKQEKDRNDFFEEKEILDKELKVLKDELESELTALERADVERRTLEKNEKDYDRQLKKNSDRSKVNTQEIQELKEVSKTLGDSIESEKRSLKALELKSDELKNEIALDLRSLNDCKERHEYLIQNRNEQISDLEELKRENAYFILRKESEEKTTQELSKVLGSLTVKIKVLERNTNKYEYAIRQKLNELEALRLDKDSKQQEYEKVLKHKESLNIQLKEAESRVKGTVKSIENLENTRDMLLKEGKLKEADITKLASLKNQLLVELLPLEREIVKIETEKRMFFKERERLQKKLNEDNQRILKFKEESIAQENVIAEYLKKIAEVEEKLTKQQRLYENVRGDRNIYSKSLGETEDEIAEVSKRLKVVSQQIDQLKDELEVKDKVTGHEVIRTKELAKSLQLLERKNEALRIKKESTEEDIKNLISEMSKLKFMKINTDNELKSIQGVYNHVVSERDVLGTELIQRNDEIALVYERIAIQEASLKNGQMELSKLANEDRMLSIVMKDLEREMNLYNKKLKDILKYKGKIEDLNGKLLEEKLKVKALSEELENPQNLNRWRSVGNMELDDYDLLMKVQGVQKKLIMITQELISKGFIINNNSQTITNLKKMAEKNPGINEARKLAILQRKLRMKARKLKAMAAELNLFRYKITETTTRIDDLKENIEYNKKRFLETAQQTV
jgi:chromosome segregation ATPase